MDIPGGDAPETAQGFFEHETPIRSRGLRLATIDIESTRDVEVEPCGEDCDCGGEVVATTGRLSISASLGRR